jgi:L-alanine-DL-glutamate epimerase-like enolase superfamily enzyme
MPPATAVRTLMNTVTGSLWPRLASLPLVVETCAFERLEADASLGQERVTTHVRLRGGGHDGLGEDISPFADEQNTLHRDQPELPLAGEWTLASFCAHVATLDPWSSPPPWDPMRRWRRWAFESAALDLALAQAGQPLHEALGREPRPVRFVNSLGLGDPPSAETLRTRRERHPSVRFKLDAHPAWTPEVIDEVVATDAVDTIDFKGRYGLEVADEAALLTLYDRVIAAFPAAILEDPHEGPDFDARLEPHADRVSFDAPIATSADVTTRIVNVKPCRVGNLEALLDLYAYCEARGIAMYGGGMGELGVGRGQIELLAALFHPDTPNDVAPSAFNRSDPPEGLPASPLAPDPAPAGFRRHA